MRLSISQRECAAPRPAKHLPLIDAEMLAQFLNIGHEIPSRVLFEARIWRALPRTTLIEQHDAISRWVVKLPILRHESTTRPAMQKHHRPAVWIAALLVINFVNVRDLQTPMVIRFNRIVEISEPYHSGIQRSVSSESNPSPRWSMVALRSL